MLYTASFKYAKKMQTHIDIVRTHTHTHTHKCMHSLIASISKWSHRSRLDTAWAFPIDIPLAPLKENANNNLKSKYNTQKQTHYRKSENFRAQKFSCKKIFGQKYFWMRVSVQKLKTPINSKRRKNYYY